MERLTAYMLGDRKREFVARIRKERDFTYNDRLDCVIYKGDRIGEVCFKYPVLLIDENNPDKPMLSERKKGIDKLKKLADSFNE